jgi:hypothetical protein
MSPGALLTFLDAQRRTIVTQARLNEIGAIASVLHEERAAPMQR